MVKTCALPWRSKLIVHTSSLHLRLTFSGLVCILSLWGRQEQWPFSTRSRVLKLSSVACSSHKIPCGLLPFCEGPPIMGCNNIPRPPVGPDYAFSQNKPDTDEKPSGAMASA